MCFVKTEKKNVTDFAFNESGRLDDILAVITQNPQ